jgi:hypothetical protein
VLGSGLVWVTVLFIPAAMRLRGVVTMETFTDSVQERIDSH